MRLCMMWALKGKIHRKWQIGCHFFSLSLMLFMHQIACLEAIKWFANCGKIDAPQNTPVVTWIKTLSTIISKTSLISFWRSSFHHSQITQQALGNKVWSYWNTLCHLHSFLISNQQEYMILSGYVSQPQTHI